MHDVARQIEALLWSTSWTLPKLESVLGVKLKGKVTAEHKRLAWRLILDDEARRAVDRVRAVVPGATVEAIQTLSPSALHQRNAST